jgi:hypothetical protein
MASWPQSIRHCPVCGVAMLASKSSEDRPDFDTFNCLRCRAVISLAPVPIPKGSGSDLVPSRAKPELVVFYAGRFRRA